jgi:hypothetical protein
VVATVAPLEGATPVRLEQPLGIGATLWQGGGAAVVVLDGRARDGVVLGGLRRARVSRVDMVVVRTAAQAAVEVVATLRRRWPTAAVLAPRPEGAAPGDRRSSVDGAVSPPAGAAVDIGGLRVTVEGSTVGRLDVRVESVEPVGRNRPPRAVEP